VIKMQVEEFKQIVKKYKDHPAVLVWSIGNEMENGNDTPVLWGAIEEMAKAAHEMDPNHPTMTVIAEVGGNKIANLHKFCPDIDIVGINSYAGGSSVGKRYVTAGGTKPFIITEFGPGGQWEFPKNKFGAVNEFHSTEKAKWYKNTYSGSVLGLPNLCLGSYVFLWGFKVEATITWYGMFLPDGSKVSPADTIQELWTGKAPEHPCPTIAKMALGGPNEVNAGDTVKATIDASDPKGDKLKFEWALHSEFESYGIQEGDAAVPQAFGDAS